MKCRDCGAIDSFETEIQHYPGVSPPVSIEYCEKCGEVQAVDPL